MNRRYAVYGTSRSGKDYSIEDALAIMGGDTRHVSPMSLVYEVLYGRKLSGMSPEEKGEVMAEVRGRIDAERRATDIVTDCHYCFPSHYGGRRISNGYVDEKLPYREVRDPVSGKTYEVVFDEEDAATVTAALYLKPPAEAVVERFRVSEGCRRNGLITVGDVEDWQAFEIRGLKEFFDSAEIPFRVVAMAHAGREIARLLSE